MVRFLGIVICCILMACGGGEESLPFIPVNQIPDPMPIEEEQEAHFSVIIDESDLAILPEDTGGEHLAVELKDTEAPFGYYIYKPEGYAKDGPEYPLLIFLHGWSPNLGNEPLENVLSGGPPRLIESNSWNPKFPFLVVSPQLKTNYWPPFTLHTFISYLKEKYQVNADRIYLTGLSLGGGGCWYYVGEVDDHYVAAIVPISASGAPHLIENLSKVPIWAFHGGLDGTVNAYDNYGSVPLVEAINMAEPKVRARLTVYPNVGHNAWSMTYDGSGQNYAGQTYDKFELDIYEWLLGYKKSDQN